MVPVESAEVSYLMKLEVAEDAAKLSNLMEMEVEVEVAEETAGEE